MRTNDSYFAPSTIRFPYELKKIFNRIIHKLQFLNNKRPHHFTLDLDQWDKIFKYRFIQSGSHPYLLYLQEKLVDGLSDECMRPPLRSIATTTTL